MLGKWIYSWFRYLTILVFSALLASCGANSSGGDSSGDKATETENVAISSLTLDSASIQP